MAQKRYLIHHGRRPDNAIGRRTPTRSTAFVLLRVALSGCLVLWRLLFMILAGLTLSR